MTETTALGAAYLAGLAAGLFRDTADIATRWALDRRFEPPMRATPRAIALYDGWNEARSRRVRSADSAFDTQDRVQVHSCREIRSGEMARWTLVTQFNAQRCPPPATIASLKGKVSAEEWALRVDLAATYRLVAMHGWDDMIFTHISARVPGPEHHFLINPYGLLFEEITASSLVKIDVDGNKVQDSPFR